MDISDNNERPLLALAGHKEKALKCTKKLETMSHEFSILEFLSSTLDDPQMIAAPDSDTSKKSNWDFQNKTWFEDV